MSTKEETRKRIGMRVKILRKQAGLSQEELGNRARLGRSHIGRIEDGAFGSQVETIQQVAEALGMTVDIIDPGLQDLAPLKRLT
jgi:transcriptional regulator with XRE-family HTH domain